MTTKNQFPPSPVSKSSSADAPARPPRKHKIGLIILKIFLALVVVFLVLVMYLQTSNAFRLVWLPMIGSKVDGKLTAGGGAISLLGNLQIDDLKFESNSKAQAADVDSIRVSVAPLSLIFGSAPRIKNAEITNARVVTESFSSSPAAKGPKSTSPQKDIDVKNPKPVSQGPLLPVQVERLRVKNFSLEARTDGRKDVRIEKLNLDLDGLSPGMKGPCKINADFAVAPDEPSRARSGTLALSLDVDLNADGSALNYSGTSLLAVQDGTHKEGGGVTADLKFECKTIQGSWDQSGSVRSVILATAETPKEQAGSFKLDLAWDRTKETIKSEVEWAGINRELLNPVLAALGPAQFESAQLDGLITVENSSTGYAFQSSIKGKNLSLRADANQKPTPPLDFTSLQKGSWNSKSDEITLAQA
ncbi:hypothetical protein HYR69_03240, partial [Candidatus Sumerlaeota bacterium]|nr:hypothetical protein [Candidatus Sumerlaeota bacterium]